MDNAGQARDDANPGLKYLFAGIMAVAAFICLCLKLFGYLKWSQAILAVIAAPFVFIGLCYLLIAVAKCIGFCARSGVGAGLLVWLGFCLVLELYRVEMQSEALSSLVMSARNLLSFVVHIPLCILGFVSQETGMAQMNQWQVPYTYSLYNAFTFFWGVPIFILFAILVVVQGLFVNSKGKPTLVGKAAGAAAIGAAAGAAAGYAARKVYRGKN
jgi:hypothetical protein